MYNHEAEWAENIPHPVEQSRGQTGSGDAYSPGWFDVPMKKGTTATLVLTAEAGPELIPTRRAIEEAALESLAPDGKNSFEEQLVTAAHAFLVRRGEGKTVIAGYPWFLDWGRDTLICARGYLSAGMLEEVRQLLITFGRFEENGTLPNTIYGDNAANRDTSDAPLWYGIVCEEAASLEQASNSSGLGHAPTSSQPASGKRPDLRYATVVDQRGRTIADVLRSIAAGYIHGTPNGIRMDPSSALVWSPKHFTWMDTNYPAATPREGYPVEIQVLWIRLLRQLERIDAHSETAAWSDLAGRAQASFEKYFWLEERGYLADLLIAGPGRSAAEAVVDNSLRSNCLFAISLGLLAHERGKRCAEAALRYLVVPGAVRSLAPLAVSPSLPVYGNDGRLLNNPAEPYYGRYEGDEDTRRKPAYHNGTAWTWMLPVFCEALARAWSFSLPAVAAAKAYLSSVDRLMTQGCLGHIPEILDGDAPHQQRGCDAQAWSITEALRVWKLLNR
jgi:glycogen debranching enzyme